jgi:hypothetical protein
MLKREKHLSLAACPGQVLQKWVIPHRLTMPFWELPPLSRHRYRQTEENCHRGRVGFCGGLMRNGTASVCWELCSLPVKSLSSDMNWEPIKRRTFHAIVRPF